MTQAYSGGLRYVDAGDLDSRALDLEDLDVTNRRGDDLGEVDGLLVDADSGRPRYVIIDSGGWFHSKRFAVPVSQAIYDQANRALQVDADRDTINRLPAFDDDRFEGWSSDRWRQYDEGLTRATGGVPVTSRVADAASGASWWQSQAWNEYGHAAGREDIQRDYEQEVAARDRAAADVARRDIPRVDERPMREAIRGTADDDVRRNDDLRAPSYGERAQPGDILGIESAGETTNLGDIAEDEDRRRERAERDIDKMPPPDERKRR